MTPDQRLLAVEMYAKGHAAVESNRLFSSTKFGSYLDVYVDPGTPDDVRQWVGLVLADFLFPQTPSEAKG